LQNIHVHTITLYITLYIYMIAFALDSCLFFFFF